MFLFKMDYKTEHAFWMLIGYLLARYLLRQRVEQAASMQSENSNEVNDIVASGNELGESIQQRIDKTETAASIGRANRKDVTPETIVRLSQKGSVS